MQHIKEHMTYLRAVAYLPKKQAQELLRHSSKAQLLCISEIAHNILANVLKLPQKDKTALLEHKNVIRRLADQAVAHTQLQRYSCNKAEGVATFLKTVLPVIEKAL